MNTMRRAARLALLPRADEIAVGDHVHGLEGEPPVLAGIGEDALGAQQVLALLRQQRADPGVELLRVDRPLHLEAHRWRRPRCARARRRSRKSGLALQRALEVEGALVQHLARSARRRAGRAVDAGEAVDGADAASTSSSSSGVTRSVLFSTITSANAICSSASGLSSSRAGRFFASTTVTIASSRVLARTPSSTKKVCATGAGLASPVVSMMMPSNLLAPLHQAADDADQVAAHGAADAAVVHLEHFLVGVHDEVVVHAELAELVDDDGIFAAVVLAEDAVQQRGLAGAEIAGQHGHGHLASRTWFSLRGSVGRRI